MGLDMYLNKRSRKEVDVAKRLVAALEEGGMLAYEALAKELDSEIAYWHKANQIHAWMVQNAQDGVDDCEEYVVSKELFVKLRNDVISSLSDHEAAQELLPTQAGFFFGSTDYDERYRQDLYYTLEVVNTILFDNDFDEYEYVYSSSW